MRLLTDGQPLAVCLFTCFDSRVPADLHATALGSDEARMTAVLERGGREAFSVVTELSVRLGWPAALATARGRLPVVLRRESDPAVLTAVLLRCADLRMLDRDLLAQVLRDHCAPGALDRAAQVWSAFFAYLPVDLLPPLFEVHRFLGRGADAVRLADSAARVQTALDCCLRSPRVDDAVAGLALAERSGAQAPILRALREHAAELHFGAGRYAEALPLFRDADRPHRLSVCLEALGRVAQALDCCPSNDPERIARLVDLALPAVDAAVRRAAYAEAAGRIRELLGHLDRAASPGDGAGVNAADPAISQGKLDAQREDVAARLTAVQVTGRRYFADRLETAATAGERATVNAALSQFEEANGDWPSAALAAEKAGDPYRAHLLYRRAEQFGQADRVLRDDTSPGGLAARAASAQAGGDTLAAARLYEQAGQGEQAAELFAAAGELATAASALLRAHGDSALADPRLGDFLRRAGDADQLVRLCLRVLEPSASSSPGAGVVTVAVEELRRLRADGLVPTALAGEVEAALVEVDVDRRRPFEERAAEWVAAARAEVDRRFAGIWGLDLGTSTCSAAIYDTVRGAAVSCSGGGEAQFAATLSLDADGNEVVGLSGEETLTDRLLGHMSGAKRRMGTSTVYRVRDRTYRPEEIAARLIRHARGLVEDHLAAQVRERVGELSRAELGVVPDDWLIWLEANHDLRLERGRAVLTIPAYFQNNQKHATRDACAIAGVELVRLLHEPTAACMSEARQRRLAGQVVVVDLGAGTLDVSVLDVDDDMYEVQGVTGDTAYGGRDFDDAIRGALVSRLEQRGMRAPAAGRAGQRLTVAAEHLKISLSSRRQADYALVGFDRGADVFLELDRNELAEILAGSLRVLREVCARVRSELAERPRHLVLVGGPMLSPVVRAVVEEVFDAHQTMVADPRTAVSGGAAILAAVLDGRLRERVLLDVTPLPLGIRAFEEDDRETFSVLVEAGTHIPVERKGVYSTHADDQTVIRVEIFNGSLEATAKIGQFLLDGLRPAPRGQTRIEVTFALDASCVLEVTARDVATGRSETVRVDDTTLLPPAEREAMARRFARQRERERAAAERDELRERLQALTVEARSDDGDELFRSFEDLLAGFRPPAAPIEAATQDMLAEMFNPAVRADAAADLRLAGQVLRDVARSATEYLARDTSTITHPGEGTDGPGDDGRGAGDEEGRHLAAELERTLARRRDLLRWVRRRIALLESLAARDPDPLGLFRIRFGAGDHLGALRALGAELPEDPRDLRRLLRCLAEVGDADRYRRTLLVAGDLLAVPLLDPSDPGAFAARIAPALVSVTTTWPDGRRRIGRGFLVADRLVATNRHWLMDPTDDRRLAAPADRVEVGHELWGTRAVGQVHAPAASGTDLVLLALREPAPARGLGLGHLRLLRLGDRVWTTGTSPWSLPRPGAPVPESPSDADGPGLLRDGTVEKFEHFPDEDLYLVQTGITLPAAASGGPLFNDSGEVVAVLTIPERPGTGAGPPPAQSGVFALSADALVPLLAAAGTDPIEQAAG
ncbi:molecular chaperone [Frankia sp. QA3]|nr:molecular chaperone [Frankia sp. QA3]